MIAAKVVVAVFAAISACINDSITSWERFWFTPIDSFHLCVARVLAGGMLMYSHLVWGLHFDAFFGDLGFNNSALVKSLQEGGYAMSFWWYVPEDWKFLVHISCCFVIFSFFVGLFTRVTSVLSWVIAVSYAHRAMLANFGLDQILCMLVMYLMLSPCAASLSVDALIRNWRGKSQPTASVMANVASRLIQLHLCVIYVFAGLSKLQGETWWRGDAVWNALANYEYQSLDMTFLAAWPIATHALSLGTIMWEVSFCLLVWNRRLRPIVLLAGLGMHVGIGAVMGMWTFGLAMTFAYLSFADGRWLRSVMLPRSLSFEQALLPSITGGNAAPVLVLVCKTTRIRNILVNYFEKREETVFWVDDLPKALDLCQRINPVVICIEAPRDIREWIAKFRAVNSRVMFVVQSDESIDGSRCLTVPLNCTCRTLRQACESLLGRPMIKKLTPGFGEVCVMQGGTEKIDFASPYVEVPASEAGYFEPKEADKFCDGSDGQDSGAGVRGGAALKSLTLIAFLFLTGCGSRFVDVDAGLNRAAALNDLGRYDESIAILTDKSLSQVKNPRLHYLQGIAFEHLAQFEEAVDAYSQCLVVDPNYTDALNNRAVVYGKLKRLDDAINDLIQAVGSNPNDALAWTNLGLAYHEKGLYQEAISQYVEAERRAKLAQTPFQAGNAYLAMGQNQEAAQEFARAIERDAAYAQAHMNLAIALYRLNRTDEALKTLLTAESLDADMSLAAVAQNLRELLGRTTLDSKAEKRICDWLSANGWEITSANGTPCSFRAQRLPVAGDPAAVEAGGVPLPPDDFVGIVLVKPPNEEVSCDYKVVEYTRENAGQVYCWFVLDREKLAIDSSSGGQVPPSLVTANYDWRPDRQHLTPQRVTLKFTVDNPR